MGDGRGALTRRFPFFRSAGSRFALVYAILLGASALAIAGFFWWSTAGLLNRQVEAAIAADAQSLGDQWAVGGPAALALAINERLRQNVENDAVYLLVDPAGRRIVGNMERWPPSVVESDEFVEIQVPRAGQRFLARVHRYDVPGGLSLLIGRDVEVRAQIRTLIANSLIWSLALVAAAAGFGGLVVRTLFRRGMATVSDTAAAIAQGDLTRRVPVRGRGDELDQLADVLNDMLDRIGRLMEGVRQVSNAIAHDLRTPIARARGRLEEAARTADTAAALHAAIDRAIADLDGIVGIFQAILRISEIESGARRASFARIDAAPLIASVAELYEAVAEDRGVSLTHESTGALPLVGDATLIQQAIANLADNAVKFAPPGSAVAIRAEGDPAWVRIAVEDRGPGIPEADRIKVTERFYRGESSRGTPGSGLGLTLVDAVARLHGGTLRLEDARPGLRAVLTVPGVGIAAEPGVSRTAS